MTQDNQPDELLLAATSIEIQASGDVTKTPTAHIVAYGGGLMRPAGFGTVVVDLAGLAVPGQVPILADHDAELSGIVGHGIAEKKGGRLLADATLPPTTEAARQVIDLARNGFQFQASVGVKPTDRESIRAGETVAVNGRTITAPDDGFTIIRAGTLKEISITALGADDSTSVTIAAKDRRKGGHDMSDQNTTATETIRADATAETNRIIGIKKACVDHLDLQAKAIEEGWTVDATELAVLKASLSTGPAFHIRQDRGGMTSDMLAASLLLRSGGPRVAEDSFGEKVTQQAEDLRIDSLPDLCRASCRLAGIEEPRGRDAMLRAAFSTTSLPGILGNAANKSLQAAYRDFPSVAKQIAKKLTANDFKTNTGYRLSDGAAMTQLPPGGEIKHGVLAESSFTYSVNTYAKMFGVTRTDIINDDLSAFDDVPKIIARGASLALEETFWTLVLANTGTFFGTGNSNYISGASTALDADSLATGVQTIRQLTDADGSPIMVEPKFLVVPPELEATADALYVSRNLAITGSTDLKIGDANVAAAKYKPLVVPYLSNSSYSGYSATAWYLFGDPADVASFGIAFLDNQELPTVESQDGAFNTLGIEMRGYLDFGCCQIDSNGGIKSAGA